MKTYRELGKQNMEEEIRTCSNCYYSDNGCTCREASDIESPCTDWVPLEIE